MVSAAEEGNEHKKMAAKTCAILFIVDVLIATTALYVGLAMRGHVQSDHGSAILTRKVAFITFGISDAITLILSISSALVAFVYWMNLKRNGNQKMALFCYSGTMLAVIAMVLTHIFGICALHGIKLLGAVTIVSFCLLCCFAIYWRKRAESSRVLHVQI